MHHLGQGLAACDDGPPAGGVAVELRVRRAVQVGREALQAAHVQLWTGRERNLLAVKVTEYNQVVLLLLLLVETLFVILHPKWKF